MTDEARDDQARVTFRADEDVRDRAKQAAAGRGWSAQQMLEGFLLTVADPERPDAAAAALDAIAGHVRPRRPEGRNARRKP